MMNSENGGECQAGCSGASWLGGSVSNLQVRDCRFKSPAGLNLLWHYTPRQGTFSHTCTLLTQEKMGTQFRAETVAVNK